MRFLCSAQALPFELFENIQTNAEARQAAGGSGSGAGGRAGANSASSVVSGIGRARMPGLLWGLLLVALSGLLNCAAPVHLQRAGVPHSALGRPSAMI